MEDLLQALEPFLSAVAAAGSIAALGLLLNFVRVFRETYADRLDLLRVQQEAVEKQKSVTEERLKLAEENLQRTKDWHAAEAAALKNRVEQLLEGQNSNTSDLVASGGAIAVSEEVRATLAAILTTVREVRQTSGPEPSRDPEYFLGIAKGFAATDQWVDAAEYYREYLKLRPEDWEVHFLRAIALANSRRGHDTNLEGLRELNEAIALVPWDIDPNLHARLYGYRGADLKRLARYEEAESDLKLARRWASRDYEKKDITYNLACVYALTNRRAEMLAELRTLVADPVWRTVVQSKSAYFKNYWNDHEFRQVIGLSGDQ